MVCVPCIVLPFLLALYIKFVQPIILRFVPERWKIWFDSLLYPTCPLKIPNENDQQQKVVNEENSTGEKEKEL